MNAKEINRDNFLVALDETIGECVGLRGSCHAEELEVAIEALEGIKSELRGESPQRARRMRTGLFIRYAIDANDQLAMDSNLKDKVVRLEDLYKRL